MSEVSFKQLIESGEAVEEDFAELRLSNLSLARCDICPQLFAIRNLSRKGPDLCDKHKKLGAEVARYTNFQKGLLTPEEKRKILQSKTTTRGRRTYGS